MIYKYSIILLFAIFFFTPFKFFSQIELVKDINSGPASSDILLIKGINGNLYFDATTSTDGIEPWKSDGTSSGTIMLKDINLGGNSAPGGFTYFNGEVFFHAASPPNDVELWKTDGTPAGTVLFSDIFPGSASSSYPDLLTVIGSTLYFKSGIFSPVGGELFKSDGTSAGTMIVKDIQPGAGTSTDFTEFMNINGKLLFFADDSTLNGASIDLWSSDGTSAGTMKIYNVRINQIPNIKVINGLMYFSGNDDINGCEPWISDGTSSGTFMIKDINPGSSSALTPQSSFPQGFVELNGEIYFVAQDPIYGRELWKTDGTSSGTVMVRDFNPGSAYGLESDGSLTMINNTLYFSASDGINGYELWKSDGTSNGSVMIKDINASFGGSSSYPYFITKINCSQIYFSADDGIHGRELWKTDGTSSGTIMVQDLYVGSSSSNPYLYQAPVINGSLYFSAETPDVGKELRKFTPVTTGTISLSTSGNVTICSGDVVNLNAGGASSYTWSPASFLNTTIGPNVISSPTLVGTISYTVKAIDNNFCEYEDSIRITVLGSCTFWVPNIFTPNGDGHNDTFLINTEGVSEIKGIIYNRWGEKVYEWNDLNSSWDGNLGGKALPEGNYYYIIEVRFSILQDKTYKNGNVFLLR